MQAAKPPRVKVIILRKDVDYTLHDDTSADAMDVG